MHLKLFAAFVVVFGVAAQDALENEIYVSNMDSNCLKCLCAAASYCNLDYGCTHENDFCGPFQISYAYYLDALQTTRATATKKIKQGYQPCVHNYKCAARVVKYYMLKFARDCNGDGVTDCTDYVMTNYNGGYSCEKSMSRDSNSRIYMGIFLNCTSS